MNAYDLAISALAALGLCLWIRGCARASRGDCVLALILAVVAAAGYFFLFNLTRTSYLAAIILSVYLVVLLPFHRLLLTTFGRMLAGVVLVLAMAAGILEHKLVSAGNALLVIQPYRTGKGWAFDEPRLGLKAEPFVLGVPEMIDRLSAGIPGSDKSIRLIFSQNPFPGAIRLDRRREENGGNWYHCKDYGMDGWLCPALFKYFPRAPAHIYAKAEES